MFSRAQVQILNLIKLKGYRRDRNGETSKITEKGTRAVKNITKMGSYGSSVRTNLSSSVLGIRGSFFGTPSKVSARQAGEGGHDSALTLPKPSETMAGVLTRPISTLPCPILQRSVT